MAGGSECGTSKKPRRDTAEQPPAVDLGRLLPDGVLEDVLRGVAPRDLAACRCVCKAWRAVVDARRLLRVDLLPLKLGGIFIGFARQDLPEFLARPSTGPTISGWLDSLPSVYEWGDIKDHCNGLLLVNDLVVNPATRWWEPLPWRTPDPKKKIYHDYEVMYLVYDPTVSPHYEVLAIPRFHCENEFHLDRHYGIPGGKHELDPVIERSEWPPSLYTLEVFSSSIGQWKDKSFAREGEAVGTLADMRLVCPSQNLHHYAVYWHGALYVHCQTDFVMRISLSDDKYHVIKPPTGVGQYRDLYLGKSRKGVYFASLDAQSWLQVWRLEELRAQMEWVLIHYRDLKRMVPRRNYDQQIHGSWILEDISCYKYDKPADPIKSKEVPDDEKLEWNSDDDNLLNNEDKVGEYGPRCLSIVGIHPYKEVLFLSESSTRVIAYHLNGWKVQDLGNLHPKLNRGWPSIKASFPYTPSWM